MRLPATIVAAAALPALSAGIASGQAMARQQSVVSQSQSGSVVQPGPRIDLYTPPATSLPATAAHLRQHATRVVDAAANDWTDTGLPVLAGDTLTLAATGDITLANHTVTPDGTMRGWRDMLRHFPVDTANAGALVGRIGTSAAAVPFTVGTATSLAAAQSGNLYLRVNASNEAPASGTVHVTIQLTPASPSSGAAPTSLLAGIAPATLDTLPRRVSDRDSHPGDAINFVMLGTEAQVRDALGRAGWVEVDADTSAAIVHGLISTLEHRPYVEVPMSTLYLFGRPQDLGFARASALRVATERHHLRCWDSGIRVGGTPVWVGAATHDVGLERDGRSGAVTHRIAPEIDLERDFLRDSVQAGGAAAAIGYFTPLHPVRSARTATGGEFTSDGRVLLLQLR